MKKTLVFLGVLLLVFSMTAVFAIPTVSAIGMGNAGACGDDSGWDVDNGSPPPVGPWKVTCDPWFV